LKLEVPGGLMKHVATFSMVGALALLEA